MGASMKQILSHGMGVNSVALSVLFRERGIDVEAVFANHHGDHPATYQYADYLISNGYPITILDTGDLYDAYYRTETIPTCMSRSCTDRFKVTPLLRYAPRPCIMHIGFAYDEAHRAKPSRKRGIENQFVLIDEGLTRDDCLAIIRNAGLEIPPKSGCYFCPYQKPHEIRHLRDEYPELYCRVKRLEDRCVERQKRLNKMPIYIMGKPLDSVVIEGQLDFYGLRKPCQCGL